MRTHALIWAWVLSAACVLALPPASAQLHPDSDQPDSGQPNSDQQEPNRPVQANQSRSLAIGVAVPLSGEYAPLGEQVVEAVEIAAADAKTRVVTRDTKGTPIGAIAAIRELAADDSVLAVIGPIGRRESHAAARVAQRVGMPLLALASSEAVNRAGNWVYRLRLTPAEQAAQLAEAVRKHLSDQTRVGIFFPESSYGRDSALSFAERFRELGGQVSAVASYPEDTTDFRKPIDELVGKRVHIGARKRLAKRRADGDGYVRVRRKGSVDFDLLFIPDFHGRISRMLPFFPGGGIQTGEGGEGTAVQMLGLSGWQGDSMKLTGAHAAGAIYPDPFVGAADGGRAEDFSMMFESKTGRKPVDLDAEVFDAAWLVSNLIEKASKRQGKADRAREKLSVAKLRLFVANQLPRAKTVTGVSGEFGFGARGEPLKRMRLYQFDIEGTVTPW